MMRLIWCSGCDRCDLVTQFFRWKGSRVQFLLGIITGHPQVIEPWPWPIPTKTHTCIYSYRYRLAQVWYRCGGWVGCAWVCRCAQVPKDTAGLVHVREVERVHVYAVKQNSTSTLETGVHIGIHNTIKNNKWGENVNSLNCIPVLSKLICIFANFV